LIGIKDTSGIIKVISFSEKIILKAEEEMWGSNGSFD
jgi:hypothetical protein